MVYASWFYCAVGTCHAPNYCYWNRLRSGEGRGMEVSSDVLIGHKQGYIVFCPEPPLPGTVVVSLLAPPHATAFVCTAVRRLCADGSAR